MPPKKKEEPLETIAQGDDERILTITVSGVLAAAPEGMHVTVSGPSSAATSATNLPVPPPAGGFTAALNQPYFVINAPMAEPTTILTSDSIRAPDINTKEKTFSVVAFQRKLVLKPNTISSVVGGEYRMTVFNSAEAKVEVKKPAAKKAPAGKGNAGGGGDGPSTARSEDTNPSDTELFSFRFELSRLLQGEKDEYVLCDSSALDDSISPSATTGSVRQRRNPNLTFITGFEKLVVTVTSSAPLLSAANILKYKPVVIEVEGIRALPPLKTLTLNQLMNSAPLELNDTTALQQRFSGVAVRYQFMGTTVVTTRKPHDSTVEYHERKVHFLQGIDKLELAQRLFSEPLKFEVHDRDVEGKFSHYYGVGSLPLATALEGVVRFTQHLQVVPHTEEHIDAPVLRSSEYLASGTTVNVKVQFLWKVPRVEFLSEMSLPQLAATLAKEANAEALPLAPQGPVSTAPAGAATGVPPPSVAPNPFIQNERALSRLLLILPYEDNQGRTRDLIHSIMGTIITFPRVQESGDLTVYERPATPDPAALAAAAAPTGKGAAKAEKGGPAGKGAEKGAVEPPPPTPSKSLIPKTDATLLHITEGVTGFEIMDGDRRIIALEGPRRALAKVVEVATLVAGEDSNIRALFNSGLAVPLRLYCKFPPLVLPLNLPTTEVAPKSTEIAGELDDKKGKGAAGAAGKGQTKARSTPDKSTRDTAPTVPPLAVPSGNVPSLPSATTPGASASSAAALKNRDELDSGGVGGRIRRIRLNDTIIALASKQRNFIHRTMTRECLNCINKLNQLVRSKTMLEAVEHGYFPTASEVIALERVAGLTLETFDVCGANRFYSFASTSVDEVVAKAVRDQQNAQIVTTKEEKVVDFHNLAAGVGLVVSFIAVPASADQVRGLPPVDSVLKRYPHKAYMYHLERQESILCTFATAPPTQLLRFDVTAQVVQTSDGEVALYVMSFRSLAKKGTNSRNPEFEAKLARNKNRAPPSETRRIRREEARRYRETHQIQNLEDIDSDNSEGEANDRPPEPYKDFEVNEVAVEDYVHSNIQLAGSFKPPGYKPPAPPVDYSSCYRRLEAMERKAQTKAAAEASRHIMTSIPFQTNRMKSAAEDRLHPLQPSEARKEDLLDPWVPPTTAYKSDKEKGYHFTVKGAKEILGDPFKVKSIFQSDSAVEAAKQEAEDRRRELEEWQAKVVVDDPTFRFVANRHDVTLQDKIQGLLHEEPKKHSVKLSYAPPPPVSIREVEKAKPLEKVDPKVSKHPDLKKFYYAKPLDTPIPKIAPVPNAQKHGPLWEPPVYEKPSLK